MNREQTPLTQADFRNPPAHYRAAPFWAWNCKLDGEELERQIDCFRQMGFGGFHMHPRTGLDTPYLSEEFLSMVRRCVDKAAGLGMEACLYDEDRWPSGFAGGFVTKEEQYRERHLLWTPTPYREDGSFTPAEHWPTESVRTENGRLLACYDVELDGDGCLASYRRLREGEEPRGVRWYAYLETAPCAPWFNGQTYVDTLNKAAMDRFIDVTYETYRQTVGDQFGKTVPSIFTDEPQSAHKVTLPSADAAADAILPWTEDFEQTFRAAYGQEILDRLPELFWELPEGKVSAARYRYHDHVAERFTEAFADNCGAWCRAHGLNLTGHMMEEPTLRSQTAALGEAMRAYRSFGLPGVDMLANFYEYTTVKQAASASHQYGREGVLSELYGVTSWSFDFRGHKLQGDWQAALGVTRRVPHLSLLSMKGEAKRDYPASINYQAPWWTEYHRVEDHFARVNQVLTRGKPVVRIAVIHPVESYWLHWGPTAQTAPCRNELDRKFQDLTKWLLLNGVDFDFISESLLPSQCQKPGAPLQVGEMTYDAVVIPGCETLRSTTVKTLSAFRDQGGALIFLGEAPRLVDALPDTAARELWARSRQVPYERGALLNALEPWRELSICNDNGEPWDCLLAQLREDGDCRWLFLAQGVPMHPDEVDIALPRTLQITLRGDYAVEQWDTMTGEIRPLAAERKNGRTRFSYSFCQQDSLLVRLTAPREEAPAPEPQVLSGPGTVLPVPSVVPVELAEPNVLLLDRAEFALDGGDFEPAQEILRADGAVRQRLGYPRQTGKTAQPWTLPPETPEHWVKLRYSFRSEIAVPVKLALENADKARVWLNGAEIAVRPDGWYTDKAILTFPLGILEQGDNVLTVELPFFQRGSLENCFLLGDFGVRVRGTRLTVVGPARELGFGDITRQELPFYGGNLTYRLTAEVPEAGTLRLHVPHWRGALVTASLDGKEAGAIFLAPYHLDIPVESGRHTLDVTLWNSRINTFGALHMCKDTRLLSPTSWRHTGDRWSEEFIFEEVGILSSPELRFFPETSEKK